MSHNIRNEDVFVVGKAAWHGLGTVLDNPATAREALKVANLDFEVLQYPLFADLGMNSAAGKHIVAPIKTRLANVRTDTNEVLGVVGTKYSVLQNQDAFDFFDVVVGDEEAIYHSAGVLGRGEKIWIMAKLPDYITIKGMDDIEVYVSLMSSHDGSSGLKAFVHLNRVVCENTLQMALGNAKRMVSIRHTGDINQKVKEAHELLGITNNYAAEVATIFDNMASVKVDTKLTKYFVETLFPLPPAEVLDTLKRTPANDKYRVEVMQSIEAGPGQDLKTTAGTAFGLYNGVTHWLDHRKNYRNDSNRLDSVWFGNSAKIRQNAFNLALNIN